MAVESIFCACAPGLEDALATELESLGLDARATPGGVAATGEDAPAQACLGARLADAVLLRLWEGPVADLPRGKREARRSAGPDPELRVRTAGSVASVSVDAAGAPLYRRGWRARVGAAPLRETLAAGILRVAGYDGERPFLDPMCGSGTLAIEAALAASRRAPGLGRTFAFEALPGHDAARTARLRAHLAAAARRPPAPIHASDRNGGALRLARKNAEAAGVAEVIRFVREDAAGVVPPPGAGLCAVNPPYGIRLDEDAEGAWRALAALWPRLAGWELAVLAPGTVAGLERHLPGAPSSLLPVSNGGIRCRLLRYSP